jgi:hypothetical protein
MIIRPLMRRKGPGGGDFFSVGCYVHASTDALRFDFLSLADP